MQTKQAVFITGATGLLGQYFVRQFLQAGWQVWALRRKGSQLPFSPEECSAIQWIEADLCDSISIEEQLPEELIVVHAAAKVSFHPADKYELYRSNVEGTAALLNLCLQKNCRYFLHISSVAAIGRLPGQEHIDENNQWEDNRLTTHYARSKFHAELEVWRAYAEGLPVAILNPSLILGAADPQRSSTQLFNYVLQGGRFFPMGSINYVDVRDVVQAGVQLIRNGIVGERFILNAGSIPYKLFFEMIAQAAGCSPPRYAVRPWMSGIAWRIATLISWMSGRPPAITRETATIAQEHFTYRGSKILHYLPDFRYTDLQESIQWVIEELKSNTRDQSTSMVLSKWR